MGVDALGCILVTGLATDIADSTWQIIDAIVGALVVSAIVAGISFAFKLVRHLDAQDATAKVQTDAIAAINETQRKQFGGNSGGIREAVNSLAVGQAEIRGDVKAIGAAHQALVGEVAFLRGKAEGIAEGTSHE